MLEEVFFSIYNQFKLNFYKNIFPNFEHREPSLNVMETFCTEVIYALGRPTINDLTKFMGMSQPNTTYRINGLVKKGYIRKIQSQEDKREYYLELTDKFFRYQQIKEAYIKLVVQRMEENIPKDRLEELENTLQYISDELMEEKKL